MHLGIITPPVPGHLHPFGALGRELIRRGHRVTVFHMPDLCASVQAEGLEFVPIGAPLCPPGFLAGSLARIGELDGWRALRFTISQIRTTTAMFFRYAPEAISSAKIDALLVDQTEPAGGSIAAHLSLPFVTICNALAFNRDPGVPPPFTSWRYSDGIVAQMRNRLGYAVSDWAMRPVRQIVARYRRAWKLAPLRLPDDSFSPIAQISQQPPAFDFPRRELSPTFHYVGPLRSDDAPKIPFPWERLDGRPLIYASLGTLQTGKRRLFLCFAEACAGLDAQLVIAHGGALDEAEARSLPGEPVTVAYAPQRDLLARAAVTLSHAGLNTVLDSLSFGVPVVAVPITFEQPGIASRLEWCGAGCALRLSSLTPSHLRARILRVLNSSLYKDRAAVLRKSIHQAGGVQRAAGLVEGALG